MNVLRGSLRRVGIFRRRRHLRHKIIEASTLFDNGYCRGARFKI